MTIKTPHQAPPAAPAPPLSAAAVPNGLPPATPAPAATLPSGSTPTATATEPALPEICTRLRTKVQTFLASLPQDDLTARVQAQTRTALAVMDRALSTYSFNELAISFNGGKDCLVLLILLLASIPSPSPTAHIRSVYVTSASPFPEVDSFVADCIHSYSLCLSRYALPMKSAFATYLRENPGVKAIFVGTRRTDPHGELLTHFDPTDHGWPAFMRVQPVIDWHYQEVWSFLRALEIPYCSLYDDGYTSLGGTDDTHKNPVLLVEGTGVDGVEARYRPAYELVEDLQERLGRDR